MTNSKIQKILIANRGEIAVRIIRACQEMNIATVAVYSEADATAQHTLLAGQSVCIGPPSPSESYLNQNRIIAAAQQLECDAVHPGYGFLSENAEFAIAVEEAGLIFIGPGAEAIRLMGSKTVAREIMQQAGVPVVPGYQAGDSDDDLLAAGDSLGYPLLVKASAGGGGKGMRVVQDANELPDALQSARREAQNAFGNDHVYLEKYIANPHHIEFQIFGDTHGNVLHLFERECSVQRRHQKIIEESPSPLLDELLRQQMGQAAVAVAQAVSYANAGTIEFLVDDNRNFYFLEMNTRLQVEHPVTELVTGLDLVQWQIRVAAGDTLPFKQTEVSQRGHAIECRVYAEDPANNFFPDVGSLLHVVEPTGPGVRVDSGVTTGDEITVHYDPMIAKLIVLGASRQEALQKMAWALKQYVILGITTNLGFLQAVISQPVFQQGNTNTHFIEQHMSDSFPAPPPPEVAFIAAALAEQLIESPERIGTKGQLLDQSDPYSPWQGHNQFRMGM